MKLHKKNNKKRSRLQFDILRNKDGNVAIVSALLFPMVIAGGFTVYEIAQQSGGNKFLRETAQKACNRVVGSSLTKYPSPEARDATAKAVVDTALSRNKQLYDSQFTLDKGLNTAEVEISAQRKSILNGTPIAETVGTSVSAKAECAGIPPYPRKDEVVYDANFAESVTGVGTSSWYTRGDSWGRTNPQDVGWEFAKDLQGRSTNQCGLEVQDWSRIFNVLDWGAKNRSMTLPPDATNPFVVELDGWCNTGIQKTFELHPGEYEISMWYRGRFVRNGKTNQIGLYLQKSDPVTLEPHTSLSEADKIITMNDPVVDWWKEYKHTVEVPEYAIYRITTLGEGPSDSLGGLFTSFKVTYKGLDRDTGSVASPAG